MRKGLIPGTLIGLTFFLTSFSLSYAQDLPRHRNPAQIKEEAFFPFGLISLYGKVVSLELEGRWSEASSELQKAFFSYVPEPLRSIITRFNELIQQVADKLRIVKKEIDSAENLLSQGEIEKAGKKLEKTWEILLKIERDLDNLNSSVDELRGRIGATTERLREKIAPLGKLTEGYKNKIQNLYLEIKEGKKLESTYLEISVPEKKVAVGGFFEVLGKLRSGNEEALAERKVDIFLEKEKVLTLLTSKDGEFKARIDFPFLYKKDVSVFASFSPEGKDKDKFYPSTSNQILLEPVFYTPLIKATYEGPVYPVLPFKVEGNLRLEDAPLAGYPVKIKVAEKIIEVTSDEEGKFETQLSLPAGVGKVFPLNIFVPSRGIIGPASKTINLPISYKVPWMMIDMPLVIVPPFPLELRGEVDLKDESVEDAVIRVTAERKEVTTTVKEKSFKVKLSVPIFRFSGWEKVNVFLYPQKAWVLSLSEERKVLVINPLALFPFAGLIALFIGVTSRRKKMEKINKISEERKKLIPEKIVARRKKLTGLVRVYNEAIELVASGTGIKQASGETIREYLELVKSKLKEKGKYFELISLATEKFLYSPEKPTEKEEKRTKEALEKLKNKEK